MTEKSLINRIKLLEDTLEKILPLASSYCRLKLGFDTEEIKNARKILDENKYDLDCECGSSLNVPSEHHPDCSEYT